MVMNGGMQGLFGAFQSVVNPGDDVLVFSPFWTPIKDLLAYSQGRAVLVPTTEARAAGLEKTLTHYIPTAPERSTTTRRRIRVVSSLLATKLKWSRVLRKSEI